MNKPLMVQYIEGALITGVYDGIIQMCAGEIRNLEIPSSLAFGEKGYTSPNTGTYVYNTSFLLIIKMEFINIILFIFSIR